MALLQSFVQGTVEDRFRIGRKLGEGGFAKVYFAVDRETQEQRALKFFPVNQVTEDVANECRYVLGQVLFCY